MSRKAEKIAAAAVDRVMARCGLTKAAGAAATRDALFKAVLPVVEVVVLPLAAEVEDMRREVDRGRRRLKVQDRKLRKVYKQGSGGQPWKLL